MCGLAGFLSGHRVSDEAFPGILQGMSAALVHRGPDDCGIWSDAQCAIGLAHRRLSILDLSPAGHQPMLSNCGRYVLVFNGEIYNHLEIRKELAHEVHWRGHSDTETLLAAVVHWGLELTLQKAVGMFAIALWDRADRILYLARDRLGEKPLYYGLNNGSFLFGSELKALRAYPGFTPEIDRKALSLLLRHTFIPAPYSIYRGIYKLLPGTILKLSQADVANNRLPAPMAYWSLRSVAEHGQKHRFEGTEAEARAQLDQLLRQSISGQMVADVPLGAFLSGGIDSSTVVALMQQQSARPVQTYTIGFHEPGYNEAVHARAVAEYLGTAHTELYVTPEQAMSVIPRLHGMYDEPFADSSQIPTFLVSELARRHVTVSLSGDGGDELFGGYNRYFGASSMWRKLHWMPRNVRVAFAALLTSVPPSSWDQVFARIDRLLPMSWRYAAPGDKLHKLADILAVNSPDEIYHSLVAHWKRPEDVVIGCGDAPLATSSDGSGRVDLLELEHRMMYLDSVSYLPDDVLTKVDRAAMAVSLETRVPFLDHRVIEFAWRLPLALKIRNGQGKWLLRRVLDQYVPREMIERPKMGFGIPLDDWLRGPLRNWSENLLDASRLAREGYFHPAPVHEMWLEHLSGNRNRSYHLWSVLMFQEWLSAADLD